MPSDKAILELLADLREAYPSTFTQASAATLRTWSKMLAHIPEDCLEPAMMAMVSAGEKFPSTALICQYAQPFIERIRDERKRLEPDRGNDPPASNERVDQLLKKIYARMDADNEGGAVGRKRREMIEAKRLEKEKKQAEIEKLRTGNANGETA